MSEVHVMSHPLILDKLSHMRSEDTSSKDFRQLLKEISLLMGYEVTRDFAVKQVSVQTPLCEGMFPQLEQCFITIVPILRAGIGMVDGMLELMPFAHVGHIGMYRDEETHQPVEYYFKMPKQVENSIVIVVDPMLATGGSAIDAVSALKSRGCTNLRLMNLVAAPEGVAAMQKAHPDVDIYVAAIDEGLNEDAYIVPGLGDAGDRIFGTK
ncbi:uracil phosphoribosyltransferase [Adlercreutzia sp. ZJ138]|uniref:uracil phosphoribosyltransferase n=1 Tax=Adlercreutzia sp. ZJ138 TaxID=2709405 RepID=UPI0013EC2DF2|nr:uracil phosphoribosyltransferase [Adlercreutzia sp. ZJ138]